MSETFIKNVEDFKCEHCGEEVKGGGYTNHCPKCLWSRHVDRNPGDRASLCKGMMEPIATEIQHGQQILIHRCEKCGEEKRNRTSEKDEFEVLLDVAGKTYEYEKQIAAVR